MAGNHKIQSGVPVQANLFITDPKDAYRQIRNYLAGRVVWLVPPVTRHFWKKLSNASFVNFTSITKITHCLATTLSNC